MGSEAEVVGSEAEIMSGGWWVGGLGTVFEGSACASLLLGTPLDPSSLDCFNPYNCCILQTSAITASG